MKTTIHGFETHVFADGYSFYSGWLPKALLRDFSGFELLWQLHPQEFHEIKMYGRLVKTPRWQQAYGRDYRFTGQTNKALPVPPMLQPFLDWTQSALSHELNGLLVNWYDGSLGHYIGPHRDSPHNMIPGAPIVTISLGEDRIFRLRRWRSETKCQPVDFAARDGSVFVLPWETNQAFTHEVPPSIRTKGRRISITLRGFLGESDKR